MKNITIALLLYLLPLGNVLAATNAKQTLKLTAIVVSKQSFEHRDKNELIFSNIQFINTLFDEHVYPEEILPDALRSYYVDYYLVQVKNGGFSQFVYNSRWELEIINAVREGLKLMDAKQNLAHFEQAANIVNGWGTERIEQYLNDEYFGTNKERDILNRFSDEFDAIQKREDLVDVNYAWLKQHPDLKVLELAQTRKLRAQIVASIDNMQSRKKAALAAEPEFMKIIRALSKKAGHEFKQVTAGHPILTSNGKQTLGWAFYTDKGMYYMIRHQGEALMIEYKSKKLVTKLKWVEE